MGMLERGVVLIEDPENEVLVLAGKGWHGFSCQCSGLRGVETQESGDGIANKTLEKPVVVDELVADGIPCVNAALIAVAINGLDVGVVLELLVNKFEAHGWSHGEGGIKAMGFHGGIGG